MAIAHLYLVLDDNTNLFELLCYLSPNMHSTDYVLIARDRYLECGMGCSSVRQKLCCDSSRCDAQHLLSIQVEALRNGL